MAIKMSPQIRFRLLLDNVLIVHLHKIIILHYKVPIVRRLLPGYDSDGIASSVVVSVTRQLEEGVDGEVVDLVHDLVGLDKITPYPSVL